MSVSEMTTSESTTSSFDGPHRVMVADDEHLIAVGLGEHLKKLGYDVVGLAADGEEAIELARREKPDMALLDIRMPNMGGLAAAKTLYGQMGIPVMIVSAYSDAADIETAAQTGVFGYLIKPITADELRVSMQVGWARYRRQEALREEVQDLKVALEDRKVIERAKGLIMEKLGLSEPDAMKRLQKQARDSRRRLADLARAILETNELLGGQGG